jgi:hypothetical protein
VPVLEALLSNGADAGQSYFGVGNSGFALHHETSAKILARGHVMKEVSILYFPRSKAEGKKLVLEISSLGFKTLHSYRRG